MEGAIALLSSQERSPGEVDVDEADENARTRTSLLARREDVVVEGAEIWSVEADESSPTEGAGLTAAAANGVGSGAVGLATSVVQSAWSGALRSMAGRV
jgi:hypothetical protein